MGLVIVQRENRLGVSSKKEKEGGPRFLVPRSTQIFIAMPPNVTVLPTKLVTDTAGRIKPTSSIAILAAQSYSWSPRFAVVKAS